jgi:tetratricopeptide (TPR) repeat protein
MFLGKLFRLLPQDPLTRGLTQFNRGELSAAIASFQSLSTHGDPEIQKKARLFECEAQLQLGDQARQRDRAAALRHYGAASSLQPGFADIHNKLGELYLEMAEDESAQRAFERAVEINPRYFTARLNLSHTLARMGEFSECARQIATLRQDCPPFYQDALDALEQDCRRHADEDWDARFAAVRAIAPARGELERQHALSQLQSGDPKAALAILDPLIVRHERWPDLHLLRGLCLAETGRPEEAILAFRTALEIHPNYLKARINLGLTYLELDRHAEAEAELESALRTDPANALARAALDEIRQCGVNR